MTKHRSRIEKNIHCGRIRKNNRYHKKKYIKSNINVKNILDYLIQYWLNASSRKMIVQKFKKIKKMYVITNT